MNAPSTTSDRDASWCLAGAIVVLPFLQALPIDFDRTAPLFLLAPALWVGRARLAEALGAFWRNAGWLRGSVVLVGAATLLAVLGAVQPAPAIVVAAAWTLLALAGLLGGRLATLDPAMRERFLAALAAGGAAATVVVWLLWLLGGRAAMPLYAHHRHLGLHLISGAIAALALLAARSPGRRLVWFAAGTIAWAGLLWSGGRAPLLALGGAIAVWLAVLPPPQRLPLALRALGLGSAGLVLSACFWTERPELGWWHAFQRTTVAATQGTTLTGSVSTLTSTRSDFWRETAQRARTSPWLGHGPDAYRFLTPKLDGQQPHNVVLQLWLELGALGALSALAILGGALARGWRTARTQPEAGAAPWLALLAGLTVAGMLDGVFYHVLTLLTAFLVMGVLLAPAGPTAIKTISPVARIAVGTLAVPAAVLLAFHAWLFHALAVAPPPASPTALAARAVHAFPSTTFGLWRWLDAWQPNAPVVALAWARWAQDHAANPTLFHLRAAQYLLAQGERAAAFRELDAAEAKAHWTTRPAVQGIRRELEAASR